MVGIDYSLSPEVKFPTALDQVVAALRWVRGHADELGVDAGRLAVGGDSAGANMSVAACLKLRQTGEPQPQALLLNYGPFAPEPCASYDRYDGPGYVLAIEEMESFWSNYTSDPAELSDPLVVPMRADLSGLPPTFLAIAECDILADCNHAFADRLAEAGAGGGRRADRGLIPLTLPSCPSCSLAEGRRAFKHVRVPVAISRLLVRCRPGDLYQECGAIPMRGTNHN